MCELGKPTLFSSFVSVRKKGFMDSSRWPMFMEQVILKCFGNTVSRKILRCPVTGRMLSGPVVVKADAVPEKLTTEAASWEFWRRMFEKGMYIKE